VIGVSCHSPAEVAHAATQAATFAVFGPIFEKKVLEKGNFGKQAAEQIIPKPLGLDALQEACRSAIPVLALGGVTLANARSCLDAGAAGIAGIRLFQENNVAEVVRALHESRRSEKS
jgi:thiamine-phosphate pyrophosphorylase